MHNNSNLRAISLGIVVTDKDPSSDMVEVSPIEILNTQEDGKIVEQEETHSGSKEELGTTGTDTEHTSKQYIKAKWLPLHQSNRLTPPDVCVNETILIYQFSNVDEYYWDTMFVEPQFRRLETVLYSYSNLPDKDLSPYTVDTSYWVKVDTRGKMVHIHTSKNDGEYTDWDIKLDTANGNLIVTDNRDNFIELDSPSDTCNITTNKVINLTSDVINITGNNQVNIKTSAYSLQADTEIVNAGTYTHTGDSVVFKASSYTVEASVSYKGDIAVNGKIQASGTVHGINV